jgi:hypothetical protein
MISHDSSPCSQKPVMKIYPASQIPIFI